MGLAALNVVEGDDDRCLDPGGPQARAGQTQVRVGDHAPGQAPLIQPGHQLRGARGGDDAVDVRALALQVSGDVASQLRRPDARQETAHGGGGVRAVAHRQDGRRIEAVIAGPGPPCGLDGGSRVHQGAVHVEKDGTAGGKMAHGRGHASIKLVIRLKY